MRAPARTPPSLSPAPLDVAWQAPVLIWIVIAGEGVAAILAFAQPAPTDRWVYFGLASLAVQWTLLLTLGTLYMLRPLLARARPLHVACLAMVALLLSSWMVYLAAATLPGALWSASTRMPEDALLRVTGITVCVGLLGLAAFYNHWRVRQLAIRAKQSELESLQARIRPHFLFNTLNTGAALVRQRPGEAERVLLDLADLFRAALAGPRNIALGEELALARRYLEIERLRFGDRLDVQWQVPADLPDVQVPALSVQPLVENAIRHGIEPSPAGGDVRIGIELHGRWLQVAISNSIPGMPVPSTRGHHVGLNSVRARIQAMTGGQGRIETRTDQGRHVATLLLPLPAVAGQATTR
ncbi:sensor histidine kinase [Pseudoxanthomonas sp. 10H]|uniref:sensor histidine kinase n=1 Tax=Pseudoxanthomonas sp. 10H TaxID=3242729 RepID=UPI0035563531